MTEAYERVKLARANGRPTAMAYIESIFTDLIELHGDRLFGDDPAMVTFIGRLENRPVTVIGIEKGTDTKGKLRRNFGSAHPEGYRKALRAMRQAEKFRRPVICFVDTAGAYCGIGAEERGQGSAIACDLMEMMSLTVPSVAVITGEGGSGGAIALAAANEVWMMENAYYSVISPEGAASIIWKDAARVREASSALRLTAEDLLELGVTERIIPESTPFSETANTLRAGLIETIARLDRLSSKEITAARYNKFRNIGSSVI